MKRFVWLVLFAFCTALAQVQPVDLLVKKHEVCGCCEKPGACGMPDCAPLPVASQPAFVAETPAGQRAEARRLTPATRAKRANFYAQYESRPTIAPASHAPRVAVAAASEPLFRVHCSYLI
jgi:hypothetical protein